MAVATTFRQTVASLLQPLLISSALVDDTFEIVPGMIDEPQTDKDRGSIWVDTIEENQDQRTLEMIDVKLRIFKRVYVSRGADLKPFDPSSLEAIGEFVQTSLNGLTQSTLGPWQARVTMQENLLDLQAIEITITGLHGNLALRTFG